MEPTDDEVLFATNQAVFAEIGRGALWVEPAADEVEWRR